jgi:2-amino-4-hydroxy-6-hydroxymethyldihydropteridine diphosphokinase
MRSKYLICEYKQLASPFMLLDTKMVFLLLGSNLGDRAELLEEALRYIKAHIGLVQLQSSIYETAAWGKEDQPAFLNQAIGISTKLVPLQVLEKALWIEKELGRVRHEKWGSRLIDIDILLYENEIIEMGEQLQIPHPRMHLRKFVLTPLAEIAGAKAHPKLKKSIKEILLHLKDNLEVTKYKNL